MVLTGTIRPYRMITTSDQGFGTGGSGFSAPKTELDSRWVSAGSMGDLAAPLLRDIVFLHRELSNHYRCSLSSAERHVHD